MKTTINLVSVSARNRWRLAYRMARAGALGTLWASQPRVLAELAIEAREFVRVEPVMPARRFLALGYYGRGCRRV